MDENILSKVDVVTGALLSHMPHRLAVHWSVIPVKETWSSLIIVTTRHKEDEKLQRLGSLLQKKIVSARCSEQSFIELLGIAYPMERRTKDRVIFKVMRIDPFAAMLISKGASLGFNALPFHLDGRTLTVAMSNPNDHEVIEKIETITNYLVNPIPAEHEYLRKVIESSYEGSVKKLTWRLKARNRLKQRSAKIAALGIMVILLYAIGIAAYKDYHQSTIRATAEGVLLASRNIKAGLIEYHRHIGTVSPLTPIGEIDNFDDELFHEDLIHPAGNEGLWGKWRGPYISRSFMESLGEGAKIENMKAKGSHSVSSNDSSSFTTDYSSGNILRKGERVIVLVIPNIPESVFRIVDARLDGQINERNKRSVGTVKWTPSNDRVLRVFIAYL